MADPVRSVAERYSRLAGAYARLWSPFIAPMAEPLLAAIPVAGAHLVLDVGTGIGALVPRIRDGAPRARVVGVDLSEGMARAAARAGVPAAVMDARRLGVADGRADAALLVFVLHNTPDPPETLEEIGRILRPGGIAGLATWGPYTEAPAAGILGEELDAQGAGPVEPIVATHEQADTPAKVAALLHSAGLEPDRIWDQRFEHRWPVRDLLALHAGYGLSSLRLETLAADARRGVLARTAERMAALPAEAFITRAGVVYAVALRR